MQRSACAHTPFGLVHGRCDLRSCLAGTAKEPGDPGVHNKVVSAGLELEQQAAFLSSIMIAWPQHLEGRHRAKMMC